MAAKSIAALTTKHDTISSFDCQTFASCITETSDDMSWHMLSAQLAQNKFAIGNHSRLKSTEVIRPLLKTEDNA